MNASSLAQAFGWIEAGSSLRLTQALAHFLWQGCAVAILYAVAARMLARASANARYLAGVAALVAMALCLPATFLVLSPHQGAAVDTTEPPHAALTPGTISPIAVETVADPGPSRPAFSTRPADAAASSPSIGPAGGVSGNGPIWQSVTDRIAMLTAWASPYVNGVYLCGFVLMLLRVALGSWAGRRLGCSGTPVGDGPILEMIARNARRLKMRMVPVVAYCRRVSVPVVVGVLRPMILLPASIASGLTLGQLEAVLVHELAHIRRFDPAVNVLQRLIEAMLFFHPAVWFVSRRVSAERENACDDLVLRSDCGRTQYADALVCLAELCTAAGRQDVLDRAALAATGRHATQIKRRVLRLLGQNNDLAIRLTTTGLVMSILLILAVLLSPMVWRSMARAGEEPQPVSMSAAEFARLSLAEQRALLVRVFQRRMEHAKNLHYETDEAVQANPNLHGQPGNREAEGSVNRHHYRYWRLGDSYRLDTEFHYSLEGARFVDRESIAVNGEEGIGRIASLPGNNKLWPHGQVTYPFDPGIQLKRYLSWLSRVYDPARQGEGEYLFPSLIAHIDEFQIQVRPAGDLVQLARSLSLPGPAAAEGKQVYLLNPVKGFLPISFELRLDAVTADGKGPPAWQSDKFVVEDSRLVGDVWMPVRLREERGFSSRPDRTIVYLTTVSRIEHGTVTPADIRVEFTQGMEVVDLIEGVKYTCDAQGKPAGPVRLAPGWKRKPPDWWVKRYRTTESRPASGSTQPGATQPVKSAAVFSMASRLSPADREMLLAAERKKQERCKTIDAALTLLKSKPPAPQDQRIEAALRILRIYQVEEKDAAWASAIRELIQVGKPAVPKLIEELDRTGRQETLRALGFVLRGIGDPRTIPALIRTIPRTLQPPLGDYSLVIEGDPELLEFMRRHDEAWRGGLYGTGGFGYCRPIREIMNALQKMTGETHGWMELNFVELAEGERQRVAQRRLFLGLAERWADWWSRNWQRYLKDERDAQLDLTRQSLDARSKAVAAAAKRPPRSEFPCGPSVTVGAATVRPYIRSFDESPGRAFLDLDSGRHPDAPDALLQNPLGREPSKEWLAWAEREGVDLINIKIAPPGTDKTFYAFQPVNMKVWRIDNNRFDNLQQELRGCKNLELPSRWEGPLVQKDAASGTYDDKLTVSFLFMTQEGTCGAIQIQPPVTRPMVPGAPASTDGGLHYKFIDEGSAPD